MRASRKKRRKMLPRVAQHHHEGHQRAPRAADLQVAEVRPVDLRLLAGQGAQAQVGLGRPDAGACRRRGSGSASRRPRSRARRPSRTAARPSASGTWPASRGGTAGTGRSGSGAAASSAPARGCRRARAARRRGAHAAAARWCPRATSRPCGGAGSARPGQGPASWRRPAGAAPCRPWRRNPWRSHAGWGAPQRRQVQAAVDGAWGGGFATGAMPSGPDEAVSCVHAASGAAATGRWEPWCVTLCSPPPPRAAMTQAPAARSCRMGHAAAARALIAAGGLAPSHVTRLAPAGPAAVAVAAIAAAAQHDLHAATGAQEQAGRTVHARTPDGPKVLDGRVPARQTCLAPPSSARCRARRGRQAWPARKTAAVPTFFGFGLGCIATVRRSMRAPLPAAATPTSLHADLQGARRGALALGRAFACRAALQGGPAGEQPQSQLPSPAELAGQAAPATRQPKTASSPSDKSGS